MNQKEYIKTQMTIMQVGMAISKLDLDSFIKQINSAQTVGPILDPTLFRRAQDSVEGIKRLAESMLSVQVQFQKTFQAVIKTQVEEHQRKLEENGGEGLSEQGQIANKGNVSTGNKKSPAVARNRWWQNLCFLRYCKRHRK